MKIEFLLAIHLINVGRVHHDDGSMVKQHFYQSHLPPIKTQKFHGQTLKQTKFIQQKPRAPTHLPPVTRSISSGSLLDNPTEKSTFSINSTTSAAAREAAQRFILRNQLARFSHEASASTLTNSLQNRRKSLYQHVHPKIDTGLPRQDLSSQRPTLKLHRSKHVSSLPLATLKKTLELDETILAHAKKLRFNTGSDYAIQLTNLTDLVRNKIKINLTSRKVDESQEYKLVVHLTVVPWKTTGLHIASRCLWNSQTDNSITLKVSGVDCDILIVAFFCRREIEMF